MKLLLLFLILGVFLPRVAVSKLSDKPCGQGGYCKDDETCCSASGGWCCPANSSVCCPNNQGRCCSSNYPICCSNSQGCCSSNYPICCSNNQGCCSSNYPICCSNNQGCCPSNFSVCCSNNSCCPSNFPVCCSNYCCTAGATCCSSGSGCCTTGIKSETKSGEMFHSIWKQDTSTTVVKYTFVPVSSSLPGPCNTYDAEKGNEGYHPCVYKDPVKHILTIGVGFNLEKPGAKEQIEGVGADYNAVLNGSQCLNATQIETLFNEDMNTAVSCASSWLVGWLSLGVVSQSAVADMAFNLGCSGLEAFVCLRNALNRSPPDLQWAAQEMRNSTWCGQVKSRCDQDVQCMLQGLKKE